MIDLFISYGTGSPKTKIAILLNLSQGGSHICQVKHLFVKPKRVRNSRVNWIWKRIHGILHGGLASVKVNPELSQNKRQGQWNEQIIKKKKCKNCFIKYSFVLVGPEFDQCELGLFRIWFLLKNIQENSFSHYFWPK